MSGQLFLNSSLVLVKGLVQKLDYLSLQFLVTFLKVLMKLSYYLLTVMRDRFFLISQLVLDREQKLLDLWFTHGEIALKRSGLLMKLDLIIVWQFVTAGSLIGFVLIKFFLNAWLFGGLDVSTILVGFVVRISLVLG